MERRAEQWKDPLDDSTDAYHSTVVAETGGRIIGFANYGREQEGDLNYQGELFAIYILKEFQGRGVGQNLVREAVAGLLALDISSMLVWVLSGNPSRRFYEQLGGKILREKSIQIGESTLLEGAYGWRDIRSLAA